MKHIYLIALLLLAVISACTSDPEPDSRVKVGDSLPWFSVVMNDGRTVTPATLLGHEAVIVFFNTQCPDCRRELPLLQARYDAYSEVEYVCISRGEGSQSISQYWADNGLTLPWSAQPDRKVYNLFATSGIPRTYTVSPAGLVTALTAP